jgi:hypothetical protein
MSHIFITFWKVIGLIFDLIILIEIGRIIGVSVGYIIAPINYWSILVAHTSFTLDTFP